MIEYFVLLAVLLALSAFFSSSETAYLSIEGVRLEHERQRKLPGADRAAGLLAEPRRLLASILVGNNLVNTGAATVGAVIAQDLIGGSGGLSIVVATVAVTVLLVIFGEIGPKSVALHHNLTLARPLLAAPDLVVAADRARRGGAGLALAHLAADRRRRGGGEHGALAGRAAHRHRAVAGRGRAGRRRHLGAARRAAPGRGPRCGGS